MNTFSPKAVHCVLLCVCCLRGVSDIRVAHQLISWLTEEWHAGDALSNPCYYYWHYLDRWQVARPRNGCQDHNKQIKKRVDLPFPLYEYSFPTGSLNLISREPLAGLFCLPRDRVLYAWNHRQRAESLPVCDELMRVISKVVVFFFFSASAR